MLRDKHGLTRGFALPPQFYSIRNLDWRSGVVVIDRYNQQTPPIYNETPVFSSQQFSPFLETRLFVFGEFFRENSIGRFKSKSTPRPMRLRGKTNFPRSHILELFQNLYVSKTCRINQPIWTDFLIENYESIFEIRLKFSSTTFWTPARKHRNFSVKQSLIRKEKIIIFR